MAGTVLPRDGGERGRSLYRHLTHVALLLVCLAVPSQAIVLRRSGEEGLGFYHRGALFGPAARDSNVTGSMVFAHITLPLAQQGLCRFLPAPLLANSVVVVERGNCSFADKSTCHDAELGIPNSSRH